MALFIAYMLHVLVMQWAKKRVEYGYIETI